MVYECIRIIAEIFMLKAVRKRNINFATGKTQPIIAISHSYIHDCLMQNHLM